MKLNQINTENTINELERSAEALSKMIEKMNKFAGEGLLDKEDLKELGVTEIVIVDEPDDFDPNTAEPVDIDSLDDFNIVCIYEISALYFHCKIEYK